MFKYNLFLRSQDKFFHLFKYTICSSITSVFLICGMGFVLFKYTICSSITFNTLVKKIPFNLFKYTICSSITISICIVVKSPPYLNTLYVQV